MQSLVDPTPLLGGDVPSYHVVMHPIQRVVEEVVVSMKSLTYPTLLSKSVESTKVVTLMRYLVNPTLLMRSDVSTDYAFSISISILP
jgi:hypothetical protein